MTLIVSVAEVRDYLRLETNNPTGNSQYTDNTIGSNILAAQDALEHSTNRWLVDRTAASWTGTTMFAPIVALPGFRTFTTITWNGTAQAFSGSGATVFPLPDAQGTGLYTALQFRTIRPSYGRGAWYLSDPQWFDKGLDLPLSGYRGADTSAANDLVIVGDGGYASGSEPYALRHAVKVLASFYTKRPDSILADVAITPAGGVLNYSQMPPEVADFVGRWRGGSQMVSV